jgi:hypothetical protein
MDCRYCGEEHVLVDDLCEPALHELAERLRGTCFVCGDQHKIEELELCNICLQWSCDRRECRGQCLCSFEHLLRPPW